MMPAQQFMPPFAPMLLTVSLKNEALWNEFSAITTEMIVSKPGRKLFPPLPLNIHGLDPNDTFKIEVHFLRANPYRYKFESASGSWVSMGEEHEAEGSCGSFAQMHGPSRTGRELMEKEIELANFSLTNNPDEKKDNMVFLQSQHKYVPVVRVFHVMSGAHGEYSLTKIGDVPLYAAQFIAVTCYQNDAIKKLKVARNPFARGSRSIHNTEENRCDLESLSRKRVVERKTKEEKPVKKGKKASSPTPSPSSLPSQSYPSSSTSSTLSSPTYSPYPDPSTYPFSFPSSIHPPPYNPFLASSSNRSNFPSYDPYSDPSSYVLPPSSSSSFPSYPFAPSNSFPPPSSYPSSTPSSAFPSTASSIASPSTPAEPIPHPPAQNPTDPIDALEDINPSSFFVAEDPDFEKYVHQDADNYSFVSL